MTVKTYSEKMSDADFVSTKDLEITNLEQKECLISTQEH